MPKTKGATDTKKRVMNANSLKNLKPITDKEKQRLGGKNSSIAKREKKLLRNIITDYMNMPLKPGDIEEVQTLAETKGKNLSVNEALTIAQIKKAMAGDTRALEFLRDTMGEKPTERIQTEITGTGKLDEILSQLDDKKDDKK